VDTNTIARIESREDLAAKTKGRKNKTAAAEGLPSSSSSGGGVTSASSSTRPQQYKSTHTAPYVPLSHSSSNLALNMASTQLASPRSAVVHIPNQYVPGGRLPVTRPPPQQQQQQQQQGGGSYDKPPASSES